MSHSRRRQVLRQLDCTCLTVSWSHSDDRRLLSLKSGLSAGMPIALRVIYRHRFTRGPFHLRAFTYPVALTAVLWICFITIALILPEENPVSSTTLNYAVVAVGIVLVYSLGFWVISARKWFKGPVKQILGELSHLREGRSC